MAGSDVGDGGCAEAHETKTETKPSTEQAARADRSPPRPPRGNKESREDYFFEGPHFGEVVPISLRPRCPGWVAPYIFL
eukprot:COSAG01_NODE_950_length_12503_cov_39.622057_4_plen_79_part_00